MATRTKRTAPPIVSTEAARAFASAIGYGPNHCPSLALEAVWNRDGELGFIAWGDPNSSEWPHTIGNPF